MIEASECVDNVYHYILYPSLLLLLTNFVRSCLAYQYRCCALGDASFFAHASIQKSTCCFRNLYSASSAGGSCLSIVVNRVEFDVVVVSKRAQLDWIHLQYGCCLIDSVMRSICLDQLNPLTFMPRFHFCPDFHVNS